MHRGDGRYGNLHVWMIGMERHQAGNQPTHREARWSAHTDDAPGFGSPACLGGGRNAIKRQTDLSGERTADRRRDHSASRSDEKALTHPSLQGRYLPTDGAMGQAEFRSRLRIASRAGSDFENPKGVKGRQAAHGAVRKTDGYGDLS